MPHSHYAAVVVGASLGGFRGLRRLALGLDPRLPWPVAAVLHVADDVGGMVELFDAAARIRVREAREREKAQAGCFYLAPADYHLLIEGKGRFMLSHDARVNYSRPSIDVLFESAADAYRSHLIGIVLTGANEDGANGLAAIRSRGGLAIVQDPTEAEAPTMPAAALRIAGADCVLPIDGIAPYLNRLAGLS